jgi:hypothetical protein
MFKVCCVLRELEVEASCGVVKMRSPTTNKSADSQRQRSSIAIATPTHPLTTNSTQHNHGDSLTLPQTLSRLTPDHTSPPSFAHFPTRLANHTFRPSVRQRFRPSSSARTSIRRAERQHGRSGSQLHAPATLERESQSLQRVLWRLPLWTEHERFLRGFP